MTRETVWNWSKVAAIATVLAVAITLASRAVSVVFCLGADRQSVGNDLHELRRDVDNHERRLHATEGYVREIRTDVRWIRSFLDQEETAMADGPKAGEVGS